MPFEWSRERGAIDFVAAGLWVDDLVQELAIIGHQQEPSGVLVEAADAVKAWVTMGEALGQKVIDG